MTTFTTGFQASEMRALSDDELAGVSGGELVTIGVFLGITFGAILTHYGIALSQQKEKIIVPQLDLQGSPEVPR